MDTLWNFKHKKEKFNQLSSLMNDSEIWKDEERYMELSRQHSTLYEQVSKKTIILIQCFLATHIYPTKKPKSGNFWKFQFLFVCFFVLIKLFYLNCDKM